MVYPGALCPSDDQTVTIYWVDNLAQTKGIAKSNYVGVAGAFFSSFRNISGEPCKGMFARDSEVTIGEISDGTSNTAMLGESIWYGDGFLSANESTGDSFRWDPVWYARANGGGGGGSTTAVVRTGQAQISPPASLLKAGVADPEVYRNALASTHPGGLNFAYADGSVHFLNNGINNNETTLSQFNSGAQILGTFQRLTAMNDGLVIDSF